MNDEARQRAWRAAGEAAAALVGDGDRVGLGTGRAAAAAIRALGRRVSDGLACRGVPTSRASEALAREVGIPVMRMAAPVDLAIDGADVVDPLGRAIKGGGGALVREAVVDCTASRFVVVVDAPKIVTSLDAWGGLPVAVVPFAAGFLTRALSDLSPTRRPGRSDDGLVILDVHPAPGVDWEALEVRLRALPGVVQTGLFRVNAADVLIGHPDGSVTRMR